MKYSLLYTFLMIPVLGLTQVNTSEDRHNSGDTGKTLPWAIETDQLKSSAINDVLFEISNNFKIRRTSLGLLNIEFLFNGDNIFIGADTGDKTDFSSYPQGYNNTFVGTYSGSFNTIGYANTFIGQSAGDENDEGNKNTFIGNHSGYYNDNGDENTFLGYRAGNNIANSNKNTFVGAWSGYGQNSGDQNVMIGHGAGSVSANGTGSGNIMIGYEAGSLLHVDNKLFIENGYSISPLIYGDFDTDMLTIHGNLGVRIKNPRSELHVLHGSSNGGGTTGLRLENSGANDNWWNFYTINSSGNLALFSKDGGSSSVGSFDNVTGAYTCTSDRRVKKNIQNLDDVLDKVKRLDAKSYHFKVQSDEDEKTIGLIAQDVLDLFPELVGYDDETDRYSLDYATLSVVAIKAIQEQQEIIENLLLNQEKILRLLQEQSNYKIEYSK